MDSDVVEESERCCKAVNKGYELIYKENDIAGALKVFGEVKEDVEKLQKTAKKAAENFLEETRKARQEIEDLEYVENQFKEEIGRLNSDKIRAECYQRNEERVLEDAEIQLKQAKSTLSKFENDLRHQKKKVKAKKRKATGIEAVVDAAAGGILGAVVGAATGGIPGAVVGAAFGLRAGDEIYSDEVDQARTNVNTWKSEVERINKNIDSIRDTITKYELDIENYKSRITSNQEKANKAHEKVTSLKITNEFFINAEDYWTKFISMSQVATRQIDRLKELVDRAVQKKNYRVLKANGTMVLVGSFLEAWQEVSKKGQIVQTNVI